MVQIDIADTGSGIAPEHLPHIFERFYRAAPARERQNGNAGLGLSIARGLIEAMHGRISVTSAVGVGTTVSIALPRGEATIAA
jgi:signal transduction histidine kinase